MKIIKEGKVPKYTYRGKCSKCNCVFVCEPSEVRSGQGTRDRRGRDFAYCPTVGCGKDVAVIKIRE